MTDVARSIKITPTSQELEEKLGNTIDQFDGFCK